MLFKMFSKMITLKTFFLNSLVICFCLNIVYCRLTSLLINILNQSITKQISDQNAILTYFEYFLDCLQLYLTEAKDAKDVDVTGICIQDLSIEETFIKPFFIIGAFIVGISIGIDIELFSIS